MTRRSDPSGRKSTVVCDSKPRQEPLAGFLFPWPGLSVGPTLVPGRRPPLGCGCAVPLAARGLPAIARMSAMRPTCLAGWHSGRYCRDGSSAAWGLCPQMVGPKGGGCGRVWLFFAFGSIGLGQGGHSAAHPLFQCKRQEKRMPPACVSRP